MDEGKGSEETRYPHTSGWAKCSHQSPNKQEREAGQSESKSFEDTKLLGMKSVGDYEPRNVDTLMKPEMTRQ